MKIEEAVRKALKDYEILVDEDWEDTEHLFLLDMGASIITSEKEKEISLAFNLSRTALDEAAILTLKLSKIKAKVEIYSNFIFDDNNDYLDGEEAQKYYDKEMMKYYRKKLAN